MVTGKIITFFKKHTILLNMLIIVAVDCVLLVIGYFGLGKFTHHGEYQIVPDLHGLTLNEAVRILQKENLRIEISDSIYEANTAPGSIIEQSPKAGAKIKDNRAVYATIRSFSTKTVAVPAIIDMSLRQGTSVLQGLGITAINISRVPSEYPDLIIDLKMNGLSLRAGDKIPVNAKVTLVVGDGSYSGENVSADTIDLTGINDFDDYE